MYKRHKIITLRSYISNQIYSNTWFKKNIENTYWKTMFIENCISKYKELKEPWEEPVSRDPILIDTGWWNYKSLHYTAVEE